MILIRRPTVFRKLHLKGKSKSFTDESLKFYCSLFFLFTSLALKAQKSLEVNVLGSSQPILLFPGFTCTSKVFEEIRESLSENYKVHAFTFAGFAEMPPIEFPRLATTKEEIHSLK